MHLHFSSASWEASNFEKKPLQSDLVPRSSDIFVKEWHRSNQKSDTHSCSHDQSTPPFIFSSANSTTMHHETYKNNATVPMPFLPLLFPIKRSDKTMKRSDKNGIVTVALFLYVSWCTCTGWCPAKKFRKVLFSSCFRQFLEKSFGFGVLSIFHSRGKKFVLKNLKFYKSYVCFSKYPRFQI